MRSAHLARLAAPVAILALAGCWVPLERGELMEGRIGKLEAESAENSRRIEEQQRLVKDRVATVDKKVAEVQQKIDELNQAARRSGADLGVSVTRLQDDLAKAKGDLEVEQHKLGQLEQSLADMQAANEKRFAALRGRGALDEADAKELLSALPRPDDKPAVLALAQREEGKGNAGVARQLYLEYLRRWPGDGAAPEAAMHSAELAVQQGRFREALNDYGWIYKNAPKSERVPDAMLGMANSMLELDDLRAEASNPLQDLITRYPRSAAAAKAKAKLAELRAKAKKPAGKKPVK
jgi:TolA-binding protein